MPRNKTCLGYKQAYDDQNTKAFQFQNFSLTRSSAMVLEGLRDLTRLRAAAVAKPPADEVSFEERWHKLQKYLILLHNFVERSGELMDAKARAQLAFDWCVPQASSPNFQSLHGVRLELVMALMLGAAVLRQQADALSLRTCDSAAEEPEDFAASARLFQRAAGLLQYADTEVLQVEEAPASDNVLVRMQSARRLRQVLPHLVRAMAKACLGEAQAVFASRAEARGTSPGLVAALHGGASELFETAAAELRPHQSGIASQRFRMFLALSSELHQVRARIYIAAQQSREGRPGAACADLLDASKRINDARVAIETDLRWKEVFSNEQQVVTKQMPKYETERQVVSIERIAPQRSKAPDPKTLAKPIPYEPEKLTVEVF